MFFLVLHQKLGNCPHQRAVWIGGSQQETHTKKHLVHRQGRAPLLLQDVEADFALGVDIAVVDSGAKCHSEWFERVFSGETDVQVEGAILVRGSRGSSDGGSPL